MMMGKSARGNNAKRRLFRWVVMAISAVVVIPPAVGLAFPEDSRRFEAVELEETTYVEVSFQNRRQNIGLAGMLFKPAGEGPFPAAVIIQGSGTSRRGNGWYLTVADHLQKHGIVVLLPDKRGSEHSEGDWRSASFEDLATDAQAALSFLTSQDEVEISTMGVVGMSQGGRIAPLVADENTNVSWLVGVAGGAVPAFEALRYEETHNLREMGFLPGVSDVLAYPSTWVLITVTASDFWKAVGNFDPTPYWASVSQPALVIYGEEDTNAPTEASVEHLERLGNPEIEISVYEGSGHAVEDPIGQGSSIFRRDALDEITEFIHRHS